MRNVSEKSCRKSKHTFYVQQSFTENRAVLWANVEKCGGAREATNEDTIWSIRVSCWISKATRVHAHAHAHARTHIFMYVILSAFPHQQRFRKHALMLRYTYIAPVVDIQATYRHIKSDDNTLRNFTRFSITSESMQRDGGGGGGI
jgi:hypothetical protein